MLEQLNQLNIKNQNLLLLLLCNMSTRLKITFLGTGTSQGIPVIGCNCTVCESEDSRDKRLRSSVLVQYGKTNLVIDAGPDFRQQILKSQIISLDALLLTHEHKDHITGMDDLRAFNRISGSAVPVYCEQRVAEAVKHEFGYAFSEFRYPGVPQFDLRIIDDLNPFEISGETIIPVRGMHYKLPVLGFRISNFAYLTDMNAIPVEEEEKLRNLDVMVIDALRHEPHISHFSLDEALEVIRKLKPNVAYLTHISHGLKKHSKVTKQLPDNVFPAYDGNEIFCK